VSFVAGDKVRVAPRAHEGHHRTPAYLKGKSGTIERVHERFPNPETRAYGQDESLERLYLVGFDPHHVWVEYDGRSDDRLLADVFEHWLERSE
jgi:nitrile hydratase